MALSRTGTVTNLQRVVVTAKTSDGDSPPAETPYAKVTIALDTDVDGSTETQTYTVSDADAGPYVLGARVTVAASLAVS